jgi:hypothetical protein
VGFPGNEAADEETLQAVPSARFNKLEEKQTPRRTTRKMGNINFHNDRKPFFEITKTMNRHEHVVVSRLRTPELPTRQL